MKDIKQAPLLHMNSMPKLWQLHSSRSGVSERNLYTKNAFLNRYTFHVTRGVLCVCVCVAVVAVVLVLLLVDSFSVGCSFITFASCSLFRESFITFLT